MRPILFSAAIIGAASVLASTDAMAQLDSNQAPVLGAEFYAPFFFGSRHVDEPVSSKKQVSTKQGSARHGSILRPAASTRISTGPASRPVIPLPDHALLTPQAEFDCEFKTILVDDASNQPQPSPTRAQADPSTAGALRVKLDYERQCYRHADIILRDSLRQLQAAVGETIEAVNRSEQPAATTGISTGPASRPVIPLPDHALLTPQAEFDCEFKTTVVDDASNQPQPSPTRAQADPSPDVVLGMKLDYERQCYQHTAMIVRHRLRLLQASVGETIKAAFFGTIKAEPPQEAQ